MKVEHIKLKRRLARAATGLALGLFAARVIAEATRVAWSPWALLALIASSCAACVGFSLWLGRRGAALPLAPALVLLIYVAWPQRDGHVALVVASIAFLSCFAFYVSRFTLHTLRSTLIDGFTFAVTFAIYFATLQKDVLPADSGEFQLTVTTLVGILHQPGYPLYTLAGKLFTLLPIGTPALRLSLMSVFLAAGTLTLVGATVRKLLDGRIRRVWGSLAAVLALGTATTFWAQATTANIRMPTAFFVAWCLYLLIAYRQSQAAKARYVMLFALAFSLGLGHYFPLAFMGLIFTVFLVSVDLTLIRQPRRWRRPLAVLALAQLVWLYLPIHAAIAPTPETRGLTSLNGFLWYALGQGFAGDMLAFAGPAYLPARLALLPTLFPFQVSLALLAAALVGGVILMWRDWRVGVMLIGAFLVHTFVAITYRAPQTVEYEMPAYVLLAVMIGYGVGQVSNLKSRISWDASQIGDLRFEFYNLQFIVIASVVVAGLANGVAHAPSFVALASDRSTREYVEPILRDAPEGAIILSDWHYATPMWYLQQVEGMRRDITVRYVYPVPGQEISQVWRGLIETNIVTPTIVTHYWGMQYSTMPYTFEPFHQAWLVRSQPSFDVPRDLTPLSVEFDGKIRLAGYRASPMRASPGQTLDVTLALQSIGQLDRDYSLTVRLVGPDGAQHAQQDRLYPTRTFAPGEVRLDRLVLPLEPTLAPGRYTVMVGAYFVSPEGILSNLAGTGGAQLARVAAFDLAPGDDPLPTLHPLDVSFIGGPTLAGADYDTSYPSLRVYLHWRGPSRAGIVARVGDAAVTLPELPQGAAFVTAHDLPMTFPLQLNVAGPDGRLVIGAGAWGWPVSFIRLPLFHSTDRYVILGGQMILTGVESPRREVAPGQFIDVTLRFLSIKPLVASDVMSVRIEAQGGGRLAGSDDHPAANAIPTLKWIAGSVVDDRRHLQVPADARPGRAAGYLRVYDEFREELLPPLDARMGDDVPLGTWNVLQ